MSKWQSIKCALGLHPKKKLIHDGLIQFTDKPNSAGPTGAPRLHFWEGKIYECKSCKRRFIRTLKNHRVVV